MINNDTKEWNGSTWVKTGNAGVFAQMDTPPAFRNVIINGGFDVWQRGNTPTVSNGGYLADRWLHWFNGTGSTRSCTRQGFTLAAAPAATREPTSFLRYTQSVAGSGADHNYLLQPIEGVRTLAGQTATVSFWAKAAANTTLPSIQMFQNFGAGSPSYLYTSVTTNVAVTTAWQRFTYSVSVPSLSGRTIGANDYLALVIAMPLNTTFTLDLWGVQVEAGATATPFEVRPMQTELALCQRYYYRYQTGNTGGDIPGMAYSTNNSFVTIRFPVPMRTAPLGVEVSSTPSHYAIRRNNTGMEPCSAVPTWNAGYPECGHLIFTINTGVLVAGQSAAGGFWGNGGYLGFNAEL